MKNIQLAKLYNGIPCYSRPASHVVTYKPALYNVSVKSVHWTIQ